jgi:protein-S-isoprenylcysteine O-methyltransferase Ste14
MRASDWEFKNRGTICGLILGCSFALNAIDRENVTALLANWMGGKRQMAPEQIARILLLAAALLLCVAALIRTWASAYLQAEVVYASQIKTAALVADGPYRRVRNPLYLANILMAIALGFVMSRSGFVLVVFSMVIFSYRLLFREEAELMATQGEQYRDYVMAVPRLWPSLLPRVAPAGRQAVWKAGFKAESWYWGFAAALMAFAVTLKPVVFFVLMAASLVLFSVSTKIRER